jgi:hypothetical protein
VPELCLQVIASMRLAIIKIILRAAVGNSFCKLSFNLSKSKRIPLKASSGYY